MIAEKNFIDYHRNPFEYSNTMSGFDYKKELLRIDQKISGQVPPEKSLGKCINLQDILFPAHIKGMKSLSDWLTVSLHFQKQFADVPINGWWIVIADRVISMRNKGVAQGDDRFLNASDHGTANEIIINMLSTCKHFRYSEAGIILLQQRYSAWRTVEFRVC